MEVSYKYTRCNRAFVSQKLNFFKRKSYYAAKISGASPDPVEFQKIERDADLPRSTLPLCMLSYDTPFFSLFYSLNIAKIEVGKGLKIRRKS
jgi:hypothetical protein